MSTYNWCGGFDGNAWSDARNWGGIGPTQNGADLVFGSTSNKTTKNDLSLTFNSINFETSGFSITNQSNTVNVSSKIIVGSAATSTTIAANVNLNTTGTVTIYVSVPNLNQGLTISGVISGQGNLEKSYGGSLTLTGANTYTGNTSVGDSSMGGGLLELDGGNDRLQNGTVPKTDLTVWANGTFMTLGAYSQEFSHVYIYGGEIDADIESQNGFVAQSGELNQANLTNAAGYTAVGLQKNTDGSVAGGTLVVESSTLSYNGPTTVNAGTVEFDDSASLTSGASTLSLVDSSKLTISCDVEVDSLTTTNANAIALSSNGTLTINNSTSDTIYSAITGLGSLVKNGAGTLELWHSNSFAEITINDGLTVIDNAAALGGGQLIANGGTLNLNSYSITQTYFSGTNGIITDNSSGSGTTTLTVNNGTNTPCAFSGTIENGANKTLAVTKTGTGTLTFTNAEPYTGITSINQGTLRLGDGTTNGMISSDIQNSATLVFQDNGSGLTYNNVISGSVLSRRTAPASLH